MSAKKSQEVLRYWSALLKYQEALSARPLARRVEAGVARVPNVQQPTAGRDYAKLPFEGASRFFIERGTFEPLPLDPERTEFFENWLAQRYRRGDVDDGELSELVVFPAVHLRRDELAGVLRFPVEVQWWGGAGAFRAPPPEERAKGRFPEAPTELRLAHPSREPDEVLPFFLDSSLLQRELRVEAEELDRLFARLRGMRSVTPAAMLQATCELLEAPLEEGESAREGTQAPSTDLLTRLFEAVSRRCRAVGGRSRCFPVGLLVSVERVRATFHVQRDIARAITAFDEGEMESTSPLSCYLEGRSPELSRELCLGRWPRTGLTTNQREALERGLGSAFCAIQGPPGTGKTTLILNAVAHQLVEKARAIAKSGQPKQAFLMVTSTNNRAVDNVIEPLGSGPYAEFPLALRLGSREVTNTVTLRTLTRLLAYLERATDFDEPHFELACREFEKKLAEVEQALAPARRRIEAGRAREQRGIEIAKLRARLRETERAHDSPDSELSRALARLFGQVRLTAAEEAPYRRDAAGAQRDVAFLIRSLATLSREAEGDGAAVLKRIEAAHRALVRQRVPPVERWFGAPLELGLPPASNAGTRVQPSDWEDALEEAIGVLLTLEGELGALTSYSRDGARLAQLESDAADVGAGAALESDGELPDAQVFAAVTQQALELRELWLRRNRTEIRDAVRAAIAACTRSRSLKSVLDANTGPGLWLRRLFPCFGCTLLSLGNAFGNEPPPFERVIIDEAGQCHPAYAVSALLRARSALIIGDVHQLEPVIGLGREDERRIFRGMKLQVSEATIEPYRTFDESGNSSQSLAERAVPRRPTLRDHFRCQSEIAMLSETWCNYGLVPRTPPASCQRFAAELVSPVLLASVRGEQERYLGSYCNRAEALEVTSWIRRLLSAGLSPGDLAVITPYRGQFEHLLQVLKNERVPVERPSDELAETASLELFEGASDAVAVGTVHRFQGGERRIVVLSTTVTRSESLGFIDDRVHLLNVAASRAKEHLIVVGDAETLRRGRHTRVLVDSAATLPLRYSHVIM